MNEDQTPSASPPWSVDVALLRDYIAVAEKKDHRNEPIFTLADLKALCVSPVLPREAPEMAALVRYKDWPGGEMAAARVGFVDGAAWAQGTREAPPLEDERKDLAEIIYRADRMWTGSRHVFPMYEYADAVLAAGYRRAAETLEKTDGDTKELADRLEAEIQKRGYRITHGRYALQADAFRAGARWALAELKTIDALLSLSDDDATRVAALINIPAARRTINFRHQLADVLATRTAGVREQRNL